MSTARQTALDTALRELLELIANAVASRITERLCSERERRSTQHEVRRPDFLSEAAVAERTGLSRRTLQSWRHRGTGPPVTKTGRRVLYPVRELDEFLRTRSQA
jgi:hypothetical protein